jgi:hypothetical protein
MSAGMHKLRDRLPDRGDRAALNQTEGINADWGCGNSRIAMSALGKPGTVRDLHRRVSSRVSRHRASAGGAWAVSAVRPGIALQRLRHL